MPLIRLDHANVRTAQLDKMIAWYENILGMKNGWRPGFPFPGAWMYIGDHPMVHLVHTDSDPGAGSEVDLKLEHFAFQAEDEEAFVATLKANDEKFQRSEVLDAGIVQYNVWDPDGNHIHIDFKLAD